MTFLSPLFTTKALRVYYNANYEKTIINTYILPAPKAPNARNQKSKPTINTGN